MSIHNKITFEVVQVCVILIQLSSVHTAILALLSTLYCTIFVIFFFISPTDDEKSQSMQGSHFKAKSFIGLIGGS